VQVAEVDVLQIRVRRVRRSEPAVHAAAQQLTYSVVPSCAAGAAQLSVAVDHGERLAVADVEVHVPLGRGYLMSEWTVLATVRPGYAVVPQAHAVCLVGTPSGLERRPRRCVAGRDASVAAWTDYVRTHGALPSLASLSQRPLVHFVTAVGGRRERLERMLWQHHRNAVAHGDGMARHVHRRWRSPRR